MIPEAVKGAYERLVRPGKFPEVAVTVLLECTDAETGLPVHAVCLVVRKGDGVEALPVAVMTSYDIRKRLIPPTTLEFS